MKRWGIKKRKELKRTAKTALKKHYGLLVMLCLIAAILGTECTSSLTGVKAVVQEREEETTSITVTGTSGITQEFLDIVLNGVSKTADGSSEGNQETDLQESNQKKEAKGAILGRSRGVFAMLVNGITSGSFIVSLIVGIKSIIGSEEAAVAILIFLSLLIVLFVRLFVMNTYQVIFRRMYLEGRCYDKVGVQRTLFLLKVRKWGKASVTLFVRSVYETLWQLTIIGGIIKRYSYILVPYIVAENPDISANQAVTLSRKLMKGHKWECFVLELSFIGWSILGMLTMGLTDLFYANPYKFAVMGEFYVNLRELGKKNQIEHSELLCDDYLYIKPENAVLAKVYADAANAETRTVQVTDKLTGIRRIIADIFGLVFWNSKDEQQYEKTEAEKVRLAHDNEARSGLTYPTRLSPITEKAKRTWIGDLHYIRYYSLWSMVMLFFIMSFVGWLWEVSLHLISDGEFVNRGVMHGPWLPIYGTGSVLILLLLNKLRKKPALEFFAAVVLCGSIEYFISWQLEQTYNGMKWWDYTGYFLNLNGRICAEGLLTFGLGGMMIVYVLAPLLDNLIRRIPKKALIICCLILITIFTADHFYSDKHPNMGKGITDYQSKVIILEPLRRA